MTKPISPDAFSQEPARKATWVKCPRCHKKTLYSTENRWRPFCSQHCYSLDLGAWASEGYRIQSNPTSEDDQEP